MKWKKFLSSEYLGKIFSCSCGRKHAFPVNFIYVGDEGVKILEKFIREEFSLFTIFLVCDLNTLKFAESIGNSLCKTKIFLLDADYIVEGNSTKIRLWGKTEKGERVVVLFETDPYFFVLPQNIEKAIEDIVPHYLKLGEWVKKWTEKGFTIRELARTLNEPGFGRETLRRYLKFLQVFQTRFKGDLEKLLEYIKRQAVEDGYLTWTQIINDLIGEPKVIEETQEEKVAEDEVLVDSSGSTIEGEEQKKNNSKNN